MSRWGCPFVRFERRRAGGRERAACGGRVPPFRRRAGREEGQAERSGTGAQRGGGGVARWRRPASGSGLITRAIQEPVNGPRPPGGGRTLGDGGEPRLRALPPKFSQPFHTGVDICFLGVASEGDPEPAAGPVRVEPEGLEDMGRLGGAARTSGARGDLHAHQVEPCHGGPRVAVRGGEMLRVLGSRVGSSMGGRSGVRSGSFARSPATEGPVSRAISRW